MVLKHSLWYRGSCSVRGFELKVPSGPYQSVCEFVKEYFLIRLLWQLISGEAEERWHVQATKVSSKIIKCR